ncbi:MAG: hypothetical protein AABY22_13525, partial [Nanoarchaeota archaeon]
LYLIAPGQLNKENLKKNLIAELKRLFEILEKESPKMKDKWTSFKKGLWLLRFKPKLLAEIKDFLLELNLEELIMDEADKYHAAKKQMYDFPFKNNLGSNSMVV